MDLLCVVSVEERCDIGDLGLPSMGQLALVALSTYFRSGMTAKLATGAGQNKSPRLASDKCWRGLGQSKEMSSGKSTRKELTVGLPGNLCQLSVIVVKYGIRARGAPAGRRAIMSLALISKDIFQYMRFSFMNCL
jgi:hypothetical protein